MNLDRAHEVYRSLPSADLHKLRAMIRSGDLSYAQIAERAGLPRIVIKVVAARSRRADHRAARKAAKMLNSAAE